MRCYFNLVDGHQSMLDEDGIEVTADISELRTEVAKATEELRQADPYAAKCWEGWRLEVADPSGAVLFTHDIGIPFE